MAEQILTALGSLVAGFFGGRKDLKKVHPILYSATAGKSDNAPQPTDDFLSNVF